MQTINGEFKFIHQTRPHSKLNPQIHKLTLTTQTPVLDADHQRWIQCRPILLVLAHVPLQFVCLCVSLHHVRLCVSLKDIWVLKSMNSMSSNFARSCPCSPAMYRCMRQIRLHIFRKLNEFNIIQVCSFLPMLPCDSYMLVCAGLNYECFV